MLSAFRIKAMYEGVRDVLKKYRSGKLPKAFKMIPNLQNWEQILYLTEPTTWSAAAMYQVQNLILPFVFFFMFMLRDRIP